MGLYNPVVHNQGDFNTMIKKKQDDAFKYDFIKVNVRTGKGEIAKSGNFETIAWVSDGQGTPIVQIRQTQQPLKDHLLVQRSGTWTEVGAYDATGDNGSGVTGLSEDATALVRTQWSSLKEGGSPYAVLTRHDIATNAEAIFYAAPDRDVSSTIHDEWTDRVIGARYIGDKVETRYFDPQRQALQNGLQDAFPGLSVRIVSWATSKNTVMIAAEGPRQPETYYLLDRTTHQTQFIASSYPELKDSDLGEVKPYSYKARDGMDVPAYITLPPGKTAKNLPVVVLPHGGPDDRDYIRFDWMAQFLANRGYAVFQPNFRGSSGYGHKFTEAGLKQWGLKMQDDITDGVRKLMIDGIADPKRICIVGASYGGYAALAGAAFTPDLYACAVSWAGVTDLPVQLGTEVRDGGAQSQIASFWKSRMGDDLAQLTATSPARNADKVKCPILLLHGKNDTTVELNQSKLMNEALLKANKPVEFIAFEGEDHYLELADTRIRVLKEMERFLKQHIGN